jgi:serine/threonine protein kinase
MPETRKCPECGAELPGDSPGGFCVMCGLRDALEASDEHSSATLGQPVENPNPTVRLEPLSEKAGDKIGRYKLLQEIGVGGMGSVWMAEQEEPVRRRVALKVIKLGMDTRQVIGRFEAERQALALMDHPNIAKVLDAGATDAGRPYFVMEMVRGIPITDYCDKHTLSSSERLELFVQVCHAIQHAHQKGVIHRDIKPSNILVADHDGTPLPKVIDFGIAKATSDQRLTDKTLFTAFQQFLGTPAYMSPEQAEMSGLDIDTRADIYSLGVLLYELLTGKTPFDQKELLAAGLDEMRRTIREKEPLKPSTRLTQDLVSKSAIGNRQSEMDGASPRRLVQMKELIRSLRGDLDCIVMKCLDKDRQRRYGEAANLATDLERYLSNEPVEARPPSAAYLLAKYLRRHRVPFVVSGAVALGLVLVGVAAYSLALSRAPSSSVRPKPPEVLFFDGKSVATEQDLRKGLVLHFTFDQDETRLKVTDASGSGNHGQTSGVRWTADGKKGGAYEFTADGQQIEVPNNDSLNPKQFTLSAWVKTTTGDHFWRRIFDKSYSQGYALSIAGDWKQNKWRGKVGLEIGPGEHFLLSQNPVNDGQWHHVVATFDGTEQALFMDGQPQGKKLRWKSPGQAGATRCNLVIGCNWTSLPEEDLGKSFRGLIDEPMVWSRALSENEVAFLFASQNGSLAGPAPPNP